MHKDSWGHHASMVCFLLIMPHPTHFLLIMPHPTCFLLIMPHPTYFLLIILLSGPLGDCQEGYTARSWCYYTNIVTSYLMDCCITLSVSGAIKWLKMSLWFKLQRILLCKHQNWSLIRADLLQLEAPRVCLLHREVLHLTFVLCQHADFPMCQGLFIILTLLVEFVALPSSISHHSHVKKENSAYA